MFGFSKNQKPETIYNLVQSLTDNEWHLFFGHETEISRDYYDKTNVTEDLNTQITLSGPILIMYKTLQHKSLFSENENTLYGKLQEFFSMSLEEAANIVFVTLYKFFEQNRKSQIMLFQYETLENKLEIIRCIGDIMDIFRYLKQEKLIELDNITFYFNQKGRDKYLSYKGKNQENSQG